MRRIVFIATLALFALDSGYKVNPEPQIPRESSFIAGVVRSDGNVVPFAQYGNGGWFNPWPNAPEPAESNYAENTAAAPHSLGLSEPWFMQCGTMPNTWYFWSVATTPAVLNASRVVEVENHSQNNWAVSTDLSKQSEDDGGHHRNLGIALTINHKIEPLVEIKPESVEAAPLLSAIKQLFDEAETAELNNTRAEQSETQYFPRSAEARAKVKMSVTQLVRSRTPRNNKHLYYFEVEKQYAKPANSLDAECAAVSLFQGWIQATTLDGFGVLDSRLFLTDCDKKGPSFAQPLGIMTLKDQVFLFVTEHGWEDESYLILELRNSGLHKVLETFGG